jgi:hypothetical protein
MDSCSDDGSDDGLVDAKYGWHFDMLNDAERCGAFRRAVAAAVAVARQECGGRGVRVLDIGTGSGLLGLCAAKAGADAVVAVEADPVLAAVAARNAQANGFGGFGAGAGADGGAGAGEASQCAVVVVPTMSTALSRDTLPGGCRGGVDLVVSEVLDSALIGEDCLRTMRHARAVLARPLTGAGLTAGPLGSSCRFVPERATVWAQLVECEAMWAWQHLGGREGGGGGQEGGGDGLRGTSLRLPPAALLGDGDGNPHDVGADALHECGQLAPLCAPFRAFDFDFGAPPPSAGRQRVLAAGRATAAGRAHAVLFWWNCTLFGGAADGTAPIELDTTPAFLRAGGDTAAAGGRGRSHWRQAVCVLPAPLRRVAAGEALSLLAAHTDEDIWFRWPETAAAQAEVAAAPPAKKKQKRLQRRGSGDGDDAAAAPPFPRASDSGELGAALHAACCRERMEALADAPRQRLLAEAASRAVAAATAALAAERLENEDEGENEDGEGRLCVLDAADGALMALLAADALNASGSAPGTLSTVISLEMDPASATLWRAVAAANSSSSSSSSSDAAGIAVSVRLQQEAPAYEGSDEEEGGEGEEGEGGEEGGGQVVGANPLYDVERVHLLVAEPFFAECADAWGGHTLVKLWSRCAQLSPLLGGGTAGAPGSWRAALCPCRGRVMACVVECADLWQQRRRLGRDVQGLDLTAMNDLHPDSPAAVFSLPLACHRHRTLSAPFELLAVDLQQAAGAAAAAGGSGDECDEDEDEDEDGALPRQLTNLASVACDASGTAHALALWVEYAMVDGGGGDAAAAAVEDADAAAAWAAGGSPPLVYSAGAPTGADEGRCFTAAHSGGSYQGVRLNFSGAQDDSGGWGGEEGEAGEGRAPEAPAVRAGKSRCAASIVFDTESGTFLVDFSVQREDGGADGDAAARAREDVD